MALSKRLQYIELLREFSKNPPGNIPSDLQATLDAAVAAYKGCPRNKRRAWRIAVRDEQVAKWSTLPVSDKFKAQVAADLDADIAADTEVN